MHSHLAKFVGEYIVEQREKQGVLQKHLAEAVGISAQFLGRIERGEVKMPEDILVNTINYLSLKKSRLNKIYREAASLSVDDIFSKCGPKKANGRSA